MATPKPKPVAQKPSSTPKRSVLGRAWGWLTYGIRSTYLLLKGMILVASVVLLIAAGTAFWAAQQVPTWVRTGLDQGLAQALPQGKIQYRSYHWTYDGGIELDQVQIFLPDDPQPLAQTDRLRCVLDAELLRNHQQIVINRLILDRPVVRVKRNAQGEWNWEQLMTLGDSGKPTFPLEIHHGTLELQVHDAALTNPLQLTLSNLSMETVVRGAEEYDIKGEFQSESLQQVELSGWMNLRNKTGELKGTLPHLKLDRPFIDNWDQVAISLGMPSLKQKLGPVFRENASQSEIQLATNIRSNPGVSGVTPIHTVSTGGLFPEKKIPQESDALPGFGFAMESAISFEFSKPKTESPPKLKLHGDVIDGYLRHPKIPIPLYGLTASLDWENEQLTIANISARNGETQLLGHGQLSFQNGLPKGQAEAKLTNVPINEKLRPYLNGGVLKAFDEINPSAIGTAHLTVGFQNDGKPNLFLNELKLTHGECRLASFPVPVANIQGTVRQDPIWMGGTRLMVDMKGHAAEGDLHLQGSIVNPGSTHETDFDLTFNNVRINEQFHQHIPSKFQKTVHDLQLFGLISGRMHLYRPPVSQSKFQHSIAGNLSEARVQSTQFPYRIDGLSGEVIFENDQWVFRNLTGHHESTQLTGSGDYNPHPEDGQPLNMTVTVVKGQFDNSLRLACQSASTHLSELWNRLQPRGEFQGQVQVSTNLDHQASVDIPIMHISQGRVLSEAFPFELTDIDSDVEYKDGKLEFTHLKGRHGNSKLQMKGWYQNLDDHWVFHLDKIVADDLVPDNDLLKALPENLSAMFRDLRFTAPFSLNGQLELRGTYDQAATTAAWTFKTILNDASLFSGLDVKGISGVVETAGNIDRNGLVNMKGELNLDSLWVLDQQVTGLKGPIRLQGSELIIGSPATFTNAEMLNQEERSRKSVSGSFYRGTVSLDSKVVLSDTFPYRLRIRVNRARLEDWATRNGFVQTTMAGIVNSWIDLIGSGSLPSDVQGEGRLWISPAALYELPVMGQVFKVLQFTAPDKTAFRHAYSEFDVVNERIQFRRIDLLGDAFSLVGKGDIGFDQAMHLSFLSTPPPNRVLPFVTKLIRGPLEGVIRVEVSGTTQYPVAQVRSGVPEALRGMVRLLEGNVVNPAPPQQAVPGQFDLPGLQRLAPRTATQPLPTN